jgi:hypothetical protein
MTSTWNRRVLAVATAAALAGCGQLPGANSGDDGPRAAAPVAGSVATEAPELEARAAAGQAQPYIGNVMRDGQTLQYQVNATVTGVECGVPEIVEEYGTGVSPTILPAVEGQFCVVRYDVENASDVNGALTGGESLLVDPGGRAYTTDLEATFLLASSEQRVAGRLIPPGERTTEALVFDVPGDFVPAQLQLRSAVEDQPLVVALAQQ